MLFPKKDGGGRRSNRVSLKQGEKMAICKEDCYLKPGCPGKPGKECRSYHSLEEVCGKKRDGEGDKVFVLSEANFKRRKKKCR
jgi:hypothetical protein